MYTDRYVSDVFRLVCPYCGRPLDGDEYDAYCWEHRDIAREKIVCVVPLEIAQKLMEMLDSFEKSPHSQYVSVTGNLVPK